MQIEAKLEAMGIVLPAQPAGLPGVTVRFSRVRVRGNRAYIAGHGPQSPDSSVVLPRGKVGAELTLEQGYEAARLTGLSILASLKRELGDLDRVTAWLRVLGMVNVAPGFNRTPEVINGFTDLILDQYGAEAGAHSRSAVGMAELPNSIPVEIEAEVEIAP
jgi:enamine deaminase RidA (YjgF/YER057c/UK114 family)